MRTTDLLLSLQETDTQLDRAQQRLAEIEVLLADRSEIEAAKQELAEREAALHEIERNQLDLDLETEQIRAKLKSIEDKLYGGRVSNPKELGDLTAEADQTRRQISTREDRLIELYDQADTARSARDASAAAFATIRSSREAEDARVNAEASELRDRVRTLEQTRDASRADIEAQFLRLYDRLRVSRGGLAVALIRQRVCQGCRISLPVSEEQRARLSPTPVTCSSCGRILYAAV